MGPLAPRCYPLLFWGVSVPKQLELDNADSDDRIAETNDHDHRGGTKGVLLHDDNSRQERQSESGTTPSQ